MRWTIVCDSTELAVECLHAAGAATLEVDTEVSGDWPASAAQTLERAGAVAVAVASPPALDPLIEFAHTARYGKRPAIVAFLSRQSETERLARALGDLGLVIVSEVGALIATLALLDAGAEQPWHASARALAEKDRVRLAPALDAGTRAGGHLVPAASDNVAWSAHREQEGRVLGRARDVAEAILALRGADRTGIRVLSSVDEVDARAVTDVLFGPRRALSDPASKTALRPYGLPIPTEELCASPSRAASEAGRIGFPVRIALASPDLRVWEHPDLCVDMVDSAARVRDAFHQLVALAKTKVPGRERGIEQRLLGVTVAATGEASALLGVHAWPLPHARVAMEIRFADAHGRAAGDATLAILPAPLAVLERALDRLAGASLLLPASPALRKANLESLGDVLLRLSAFVHDRRDDIESVELRPLALLPDGTVEVREACVRVSDAFERRLAANSDAVNG